MVKISPSHPAGVLVHTAVRLSAIVSLLAPLGPRWPIYTVALPAGPGSAYSTSPDSQKIESLTQNTKSYIQYDKGADEAGETDLTVQWRVSWRCKDISSASKTVM